MDVFVVFLLFIFGLVFGSFYNVVVYRLPRKLSLVRPGSRCPHCSHELTPNELIPVVSFVVQRARCKKCGKRIAWRYPLVELLTGFGFASLGWYSSSMTELLPGLVFFSLLLVLALIDLEHKLLPNTLTLPGTALGLLFAIFGWTIPFWQSVLGAVVGFAVILVIALISRGGMGMGDVKMMALIGAFLGWKSVFYVLFGASLLGSVSGILYLYITKQDRKTQIPFGPFLSVSALVVYLFF